MVKYGKNVNGTFIYSLTINGAYGTGSCSGQVSSECEGLGHYCALL